MPLKTQNTLIDLTLIALMIAGTVLPLPYFMAYFEQSTASMAGFFDGFYCSLPARGLAADLAVAGTTFMLWSAWISYQKKIKLWWLVIPAVFGVGFSLAFPLFLFLLHKNNQKTLIA